LKKSFETAGIPVKVLPEGVMVNWRDGFWVAINYSTTDVTLDIPQNAQIIVGTNHLKPADLIVWK